MDIRLRPFEDGDLPRFTAWLKEPHIAPWYAPAEDWLHEVENRHGEFSFIRHFIILADQVPIGFCQHYPYWRGGEGWHGNLPLTGTYSIDYLIGELAYLRKGYGAEAIRLLVRDALMQPDAARVIVQPDELNAASRRAVLAAGFAFDAQNRLFILRREDLGA